MKKTKIVATLGPSSSDEKTIAALVENGVDIVRLNFSHGTHASHKRLIQTVRRIAKKRGQPIGILQDLQGPKIRIGLIKGEKVRLEDGKEFTITTRSMEGTSTMVSTSYTPLPKDVHPGDHILIADGMLELVVKETREEDVICKVTHGGILESHKGINLPGTKLSTPSLTEKDKKDLAFGLKNRVDYVALSFVRTPEDVAELKDLIKKSNLNIPVISKIEKPEAVEVIDDIIAVTDAIMVARGDLGVEMQPEKVPFIQKELIRKCIEQGIPVITATQMLESMREYPTPTRAETSDVANAIIDGTDAVMLSGETASGRFPIKAVQTMKQIIMETEAHLKKYGGKFFLKIQPQDTFPDNISHGACEAAYNTGAKAIVAFTQSGLTARLLSKYRSLIPIIAFTPNNKVRTSLLLNWGITAFKINRVHTIGAMLHNVEDIIISQKIADKGDPIVIVAGAPLGEDKTTNVMMLHRIGE